MIYVPDEALVRQMLTAGATPILSAHERDCTTLAKPGRRYPRPTPSPVHKTEVQVVGGHPLVGCQKQFDHLDYPQCLIMGENRTSRQISKSHVRREPGSIASENQRPESLADQRMR